MHFKSSVIFNRFDLKLCIFVLWTSTSILLGPSFASRPGHWKEIASAVLWRFYRAGSGFRKLESVCSGSKFAQWGIGPYVISRPSWIGKDHPCPYFGTWASGKHPGYLWTCFGQAGRFGRAAYQFRRAWRPLYWWDPSVESGGGGILVFGHGRLSYRYHDRIGAQCAYGANQFESFYLGWCNHAIRTLNGAYASRFGISSRLNYYTTDLLTAIVERSANILGCQLPWKQPSKLQEKPRNPTYCQCFIAKGRDFAQIKGMENWH